MGYGFHLANHPPFKALGAVETAAVLALLEKHSPEVQTHMDILSEACDTQVCEHVNCDMMESEVWFYGLEFMRDWTLRVANGEKLDAYVYYHGRVDKPYEGDVAYVFLCKEPGDVVNRVEAKRIEMSHG
jgi:hypothetical protein